MGILARHAVGTVGGWIGAANVNPLRGEIGELPSARRIDQEKSRLRRKLEKQSPLVRAELVISCMKANDHVVGGVRPAAKVRDFMAFPAQRPQGDHQPIYPQGGRLIHDIEPLIGRQCRRSLYGLGLEPEVKDIPFGAGLRRLSALGKPLSDPAPQEKELQRVGFRRMLCKRAHAVWYSKRQG